MTRAGDDHVDCWGASDERLGVCGYANIHSGNAYPYRCAGNINTCISIKLICDGSINCPLADDEQLCAWFPQSFIKIHFLCRNGTAINRSAKRCNGILDCIDGEDEWLCELSAKTNLQISHFNNYDFSFYPRNLAKATKELDYQTHTEMHISSSLVSDWYCNRGILVNDRGLRRCFCPTSYWGERCEYQRDRVSVLLWTNSPATLPRDTVIKLIIYLIDITSFAILNEEEVHHFPYSQSFYKHLVSLPSIRANHSFVRIDAFQVSNQQIVAYHTSWKFMIPFPFLPVRRLAVKLNLPDMKNNKHRIPRTCPLCVHGQCLEYENSQDVFCLCHNGWTNWNCNTSFACAPNSQTLSSNRCLCPTDHHGIRCFAPNIVSCHCPNGSSCQSLDARTGQYACLCIDNYFGVQCEHQQANITITTFDKEQPEILPVTLIQFLNITRDDNAHFTNILLFERLSTLHPLVLYHSGYKELPNVVLAKVFYSALIDDYAYYLILLMFPPFTKFSNRTHVETQLETSQRCPHVRDMDIFNSPVNILAYTYLKRIKFYLRACSNNNTRCFHDEVYLCFCPGNRKTTANCIIYDHTRERCQEPNYCLNGGLCVENRRHGIVNFACLCPECHYYGSLCQFSVGQHGLSLDALVGTEMRTGKSLSDQSILIKLLIVILTIIVMIGFVGNTLCVMTFMRKKTRENGCGWYLLLISFVNQGALVLLSLRFVYLLSTQMVVSENRNRSLILCQCLEYGLTFLPSYSEWLSVCVSVERTLTVIRGVAFDKRASVRTAKRIFFIVLLVIAAMAVPSPMNRQLIEDPRLGRFIWCTVKFNSVTMKTVTSVFSFIHLMGTFFVNFISTLLLIIFITREKMAVRQNVVHKSFAAVLLEQINHYKHLIISPTVLLVFALPRLVISLASVCIDTSWTHYLFLAGYFASFVPFTTTLLIFIIPSPIYQDELKKCLLSIRHYKMFNCFRAT
jgi:hypothetical protein